MKVNKESHLARRQPHMAQKVPDYVSQCYFLSFSIVGGIRSKRYKWLASLIMLLLHTAATQLIGLINSIITPAILPVGVTIALRVNGTRGRFGSTAVIVKICSRTY